MSFNLFNYPFLTIMQYKYSCIHSLYIMPSTNIGIDVFLQMGEIDGEEPSAVDVVPQAEDPKSPTGKSEVPAVVNWRLGTTLPHTIFG